MPTIRMLALACAVLALPFVACGPPTQTITLDNASPSGVVFFVGSDPGASLSPNATASHTTTSFGATNVSVQILGVATFGPVSCNLSPPNFSTIHFTISSTGVGTITTTHP
jgi:hypothetical protein